MKSVSEPGIRRMLLAVAVLAAIFLFSLRGIQPPAPKPATISATEFSAERALAALNSVAGDGIPHPVGSAENDAVRARIMDSLLKLGYRPEVQAAFDCDEFGGCATVKNVLARLDGARPGAAVLLAAHYDSVPAGPGASDDGAGVATVIEIARTLKSLPQPRNSIVILIDDGEEAGLIGARAFVGSHPWAKEVRAVVNIEARGTSGPSLMFETSAANDWAVRLYADHAARPATSSIFYTVYKRMPNDTDFSVFKTAGYQGLNFAYIGNEPDYHTPLDNLKNTNAASLQHQGDNALPSVLALANADLSHPPEADAVYFDVFERWTVRWPVSRTLVVAAIAAIFLFVQIGWLLGTKRLTGPEFLWGLFEWLMVIFSTAALALILLGLMRFGGAIPVAWVAHPLPLEIAFWVVPLVIVVTHGIAFARRARFWGLWAGTFAWWALLSIVLAWRIPGISYVVLVPTCVAALAGLPFTFWRQEKIRCSELTVLLPLAAGGIAGFAPLFLLYDALGSRALLPIALVAAIILSPLAPLCADLRDVHGLRGFAFPGIPIVAVILAAFFAVIVPAYSAKAPEHVNLQYWQDADSGKSRWVVRPESGHLPEPIRLATPFHRVDKGPFPWDTDYSFVADAPHLDVSAPTFTITGVGAAGRTQSYRALLRSERGTPFTMVLFPPGADVESVRMEGQPVEPETERVRRIFNGWTAYYCWTTPVGGVEVSFTLPAGKPVNLFIADRTYDLPPEGAFLLKSRPLTAAPWQDGDVSIVTRRVQLLP